MRPLFLAVILSLLVPATGIASPVRPSMVGASPAAMDAYPYAVRLEQVVDQDSNGDPVFEGVCSGSLISPNYVLTAAHCVIGDIGDYPALLEEETTRVSFLNSSSTPPVPVVRAAYFKDFNLDSFGTPAASLDIAVLELKGSVSLAPVQLGGVDPALPGDLRELGYGALTDAQQDRGAMQNILYQGDMVIPASSRRCLSDYPPSEASVRDAIEICTTAAPGTKALASACNGDSGGPLLRPDGVQVGVTSWAQYTECQTRVSHRSTIFARVSAGTEWLRRQTGAPLFGLPALPQDLSAPEDMGLDLYRTSRRSVSVEAYAAGTDWRARVAIQVRASRKGRTRYLDRVVYLSAGDASRRINLPARLRRSHSRIRVRVVSSRFFNSLMNGATFTDAGTLSWRT